MESHLKDRDRVGVQDAVLLEDFESIEVFVGNLQKRFKEDLIYTYIGQVLISVNPYKTLKIYDAEHVKFYEKKHFFETSPHVFAVADTAYRSLIEENREQCILISGESGAGKTEASKQILQYLSEIIGGKGQVITVKNKLVQSNPVLEAFGNAKTKRNDNSSRFGKYMDIEFDFQGLPVGGNVLNYLLEKSRVIHQAQGERNFHIFYQLLFGASDDLIKDLDLKRSTKAYHYLSYEDTSDIMKDKFVFEDIMKALPVLEFSATDINDMLKIIASILHLGNVDFKVDDKGHTIVKDEDCFKSTTKLLGCNEKDLSKALTHRTREAKGEVICTPLDKDTSISARNALAKAVYDRLFTWLVNKINLSLQPDSRRKNSVMGVLDIYGFEIFGINNFEQLCINFCNEKLHQLFIELTLRQEQEEYMKEGIEWQHIEYMDNKIICDLIEEKHKGIIAYMDEECLRPGDTSDATLLAKMNKNLLNHPHYVCHQKVDAKEQKQMGRDEFRIRHYAGSVTYTINGFIEKNNDLLFRDLKEVMSKSTNKVVAELFPAKEQESIKRPDTAITQFKNSLNQLIITLKTKEPNYIRCIKPNETKQPAKFDEKLVTIQVEYLGLMENLRVRRAGFAYRRKYESFLERYKCLCKQTWPNYKGDAKDGVQILCNELGFTKDEYQMGKTKIFIRYPKTLFRTEDAYQMKKNEVVSKIQAIWKRIIQRRKYLEMREKIIIVQKWFRRWYAKRLATRQKNARNIIRGFIHGYITRNGTENDNNKRFMAVARKHWLIRLAKELPKNLNDKKWPPCPHMCTETSEMLRKYHRLHLSRVYRKSLSPEKKHQFDLKVMAELLFNINGQKKSYKVSIPNKFKHERIPDECQAAYESFAKSLTGSEKIVYGTTTVKFDRHGYKRRDRFVIATNTNLYVLEKKGSNSTTVKHKIALSSISLLVTNKKDKFMMVKLPDELMKQDKGDIILEIPQIIECATQIVFILKKPAMLSVVDEKTIEHHMMKNKHGIIDVTVGNTESIEKAKTGHLLITASQ